MDEQEVEAGKVAQEVGGRYLVVVVVVVKEALRLVSCNMPRRPIADASITLSSINECVWNNRSKPIRGLRCGVSKDYCRSRTDNHPAISSRPRLQSINPSRCREPRQSRSHGENQEQLLAGHGKEECKIRGFQDGRKWRSKDPGPPLCRLRMLACILIVDKTQRLWK